MNRLVLYSLVAIIGLGLGAALAWLTREEPPPDGVIGAAVGDQRPPFRHAALDGHWVSADDFNGRVLLVNFWATWCAPCRREMPLLQAFSERYADQLDVVGIAIDDAGPVLDFVGSLEIGYPILVGASDVLATQRAWGNAAGALPYTVLVDQDGVIRWQHLGEVTEEDLSGSLELL